MSPSICRILFLKNYSKCPLHCVYNALNVWAFINRFTHLFNREFFPHFHESGLQGHQTAIVTNDCLQFSPKLVIRGIEVWTRWAPLLCADEVWHILWQPVSLCMQGLSPAASINLVHLRRWYPPEVELFLPVCFNKSLCCFSPIVCRNESLPLHAMEQTHQTITEEVWRQCWMRGAFFKAS